MSINYRAPSLLACMLLSTVGCASVSERLAGTWRWDKQMTVGNMAAPETVPENQRTDAVRARAFFNKLSIVHYITYGDGKYVLSSNWTGENESVGYKTITRGEDFVIIKNQYGELQKIFFEGNRFYVEIKSGNYSFRDYFVRDSSPGSK